jgi:WD40 repeat protein
MLDLARKATQTYDRELQMALVLRAAERANPPGELQLALSQAAYAPGTRRILTGHEGGVLGVAFDPQGRYALSGAKDGDLILWDLESGEPIRHLKGHSGWVWGMAFGPEGETALSGSEDGSLILWDIETGEEKRRFEGHDSAVLSVALSPDGRAALSGAKDGDLILWNLESGAPIGRFEGHNDWVWSVAFGPDGRTALSGSEDGSLILWDVTNGEEIRPFEGHDDAVLSVALSPDGRTALSGSADGSLILWDVESGEETRFSELFGEPVYGVVFSPDGRTALSADRGGYLVLWDLSTGEPIGGFEAQSGWIRTVAISPDGRMALSGSEDGTVRLWDLRNGAEIRYIPAEGSSLLGENPNFGDFYGQPIPWAFSSDGQRALSVSVDGSLILWDVPSGEQSRSFWEHEDAVSSAALSPDGETALLGSVNGSLALWDVERGHGPSPLKEEHSSAISVVVFSPDGRKALSGSEDGSLILWDVKNGGEERRLEGHDKAVSGVAFSPDGSKALSGSREGGLILWDVETGNKIDTFGKQGDVTGDIAWAPDGRTALAISRDDSLILWDVEEGKELRRFRGDSPPSSIAISANGLAALSGSWDGSLTFWDLKKGEAIRRFGWQEDSLGFGGWDSPVLDVALSPDGTALSGSADGLTVWRLDTLEGLITWTRTNRYVRELTCEEKELYDVTGPCTAAPTATPEPVRTPSPTAAPVEAGVAHQGENPGQIPVGGGQIWRYDGQEGEILAIRVSADRPANQALEQEQQERKLLDTFLIVYSPAGEVLTRTNDIGFGYITDSQLDLLLLPEEGTYRFEVRSWQDRTGGSYTLTLSAPSLAGTIEFGQPVAATVEAGDRDIWTFEGEAGQIVTIEMEETDDRLDSYLILAGPDGKVLAEDDDGGRNFNSRIGRYRLPRDGIYYIIAQGFDPSQEGDYTLTLIDEGE